MILQSWSVSGLSRLLFVSATLFWYGERMNLNCVIIASTVFDKSKVETDNSGRHNHQILLRKRIPTVK